MKLGNWFEMDDGWFGACIGFVVVAVIFVFCIGPCTSQMESEETLLQKEGYVQTRAGKWVKPESTKKEQVWWIPQVPMKAFEVCVDTLEEAKLLLTVLADYDNFQYENNIKPDYSNAGGLMVKEDLEEGGVQWVDYYDEDGNSIDDIMRMERAE